MEEALRALLTGSAAITALVPVASINWDEHPQGQPWPGIVLHLTNGSHSYMLADVTDLTDYRVQINCLGNSTAQAIAISRAVIGLLSAYQAGPFYQIQMAGEGNLPRSGTNEPGEPRGRRVDVTFTYRRT